MPLCRAVDDTPGTGSRARALPAVVRLLLGLPLVVFGLDGFFRFLPPPSMPLSEGAAAFLGSLAQTGYMIPLIALTHLLAGLLLIVNRFVPIALCLLAPFLVNSLAFHAFLERSGLPMAIALLLFELYLAWKYRKSFRGMLDSGAGVT
jgi:hypothetical protein